MIDRQSTTIPNTHWVSTRDDSKWLKQNGDLVKTLKVDLMIAIEEGYASVLVNNVKISRGQAKNTVECYHRTKASLTLHFY